MSDITVTLCNPQTGQSESIPVSTTLTVQELIEWSKALLGMDGDVVLMKDGKPLTNNASQSLTQAGVTNGDLLVVMKVAARPPVPAPVSSSSAVVIVCDRNAMYSGKVKFIFEKTLACGLYPFPSE